MQSHVCRDTKLLGLFFSIFLVYFFQVAKKRLGVFRELISM